MENPMRTIRIEKVTLNIGCGDDKAKIEKAVKLLELLTGMKPIITKSKRRSTFGVVRGKPLGAMVTLRKKSAEEFLKKALTAVENKLNKKQFDGEGNFSFGIKEYIDIPSVKYSHEIGMMGLDVGVTLERPGFKIKRRRIQQRKIPAKHKINKEEAINWLKNKFGVELIEQ
jgi:large subunit ribosomal protein L5